MEDNSGEFYQITTGADIDTHSNGSSPVPITPEVLGKYGFAFDNYHKVWRKNKIIAGTGPDMELDRDFWVVDFSKRRIGVELKGLHHLQNVYFLLKGRELEVR
jgi:hypothetical protein